MPKITLGVATYNGARRLDWLLRSIQLRTPRSLDWRLAVVDDGSPRFEETHAVVTRYREVLPLDFLPHGINRGISAGWNTASLAHRDSEIIVLLNDDVIIPSSPAGSPSWLEAMVFALEQNPGVGGVGLNWHAFLPEDAPALLYSEFSDQVVVPRDPGTKAPTPERRSYEQHGPGRVMCPSGQCFAFRREDYEAIGGFDEGYLSFYEESDMGTAMAAHRKKIGMQMNWPQVWHLWSATFAQNPELQPGSRMARSRARYITKWSVPPEFQTHEPGRNVFDFTNPKYLGVLPPVPVKYLKADGSVGEAVL